VTDSIGDALQGCTLAWSDEFDGTAGSPPDPGTWRPETGGTASQVPDGSVTFPQQMLVDYVRVYSRPRR
jgi:hypothetical protein